MSVSSWRHPVAKQWAWMLTALLAATLIAGASGVFWRMDLSLYDAALPSAPARADIVIVAVDDQSIAELGRWPWRRAVHGALLDRLRAMGAKAVALDFLFTEPDPSSPESDLALATAMTRGPPTVLPLMVEMPEPDRPLREDLPIAVLEQAAARIGHANLELDRDGMVRSVFLREGLGDPHWPQIAAALRDAAPGDANPRLRGARHPDLAHAPAVWVRDYQVMIPFSGPPGHFQRLSYAEVLRGSTPDSAVRGKYVLVGVTAQGIGDAYSTPRSGYGVAMPGVEVNANVLQALLSGTEIRPVPRWVSLLFSLIPVVAAAAGLLLLPPRRSLALCALVWLLTLGASVAGLRLSGWWWPPGVPLAALLIMYPVWSWRRLEAAQAFLEDEFARLAGERFPLLSGLPAPRAKERPLDFVEQRIELLRQATLRLRNVRRLFSDTINNLPDATLLADSAGRIVLANPAAAALFGLADCGSLEETPVDAHLFEKLGREDLRFAVLAEHAPCTAEAELEAGGRNLLIRAVPFSDNAQVRAGTIIALADITELRAAQRERDDVLRFLSHDMKSPASSLLGLSQLQRDPARALAPDELSARLDHLAQRLLTLVDGFVSLARAESTDPRIFEEFDLRDAVQDAYDEVWATAEARGTSIAVSVPDEPVLVQGDRPLLARAIVNLLSNALKFSPADAIVKLHCLYDGSEAIVQVVDQGPGIAPESRNSLFQRFSRGLHRGATDPGGAGLGLAFVRVVMEKHGGRASVEGGDGHGAVFSVAMPLFKSLHPAAPAAGPSTNSALPAFTAPPR